jgi:hypothetical protein
MNLIGLALLAALATGAVCLLRWARCPGWSLLGGVLAGAVLGPTIMGRVLPVQYEHLFVGGAAERQALRSVCRDQDAAMLAAEAAGATPHDIRVLQERQARQREAPEAALAQSRQTHLIAPRTAAVVIVVLVLLGSAVSTVRAPTVKAGIAAPLSIGAWAAALPATIVYFALTGLASVPSMPALLAASSVAIGPWALTRFDRDAADRAEVGGAAMLQTAGRASSIVAIAAAAWSLQFHSTGAGLLWAAPLLALPASWLLPAIDHRLIKGLVEFGLLPLLAAMVTVRIGLIDQFALWPVILFLLVSGDGRWLGAFVGAMLPGGRKPLRTMRLVLGSMAAGPTQLAITAIAVYTLAVPDQLPLAMLAGAIVIEVSAPARRGASSRLAETEDQIDQMSQ